MRKHVSLDGGRHAHALEWVEGPDLDDGDAASELGDALGQLLGVVGGVRF